MGAGHRGPRPWEAGGSQRPLGAVISCLPGLVCGRRTQSPNMAAWPQPSSLAQGTGATASAARAWPDV